MRILVTGGAGFIGSHVVDRMIELGHEVAVYDDLSTGSRRNLNPAARFFHADLNDAGAMEQCMSQFRPDVVSHHAAQMDVRRSVREPRLDATTNVLGSLQLLECCCRHRVSKVVYASSGGAVYGEGGSLPVSEDDPVRPESPYGASKFVVELYLAMWSRMHDLEYTALRYANVYGPRQNPRGEAGVAAIFIGLMLDGARPTVFGDGEQTRDYVYIDDVVEANRLALVRGSGEVVNIGTGLGTSVNELCRSLREILDSPLEPIHEAPRPGEIRRIVLDTSRAGRVLQWRPRVDLRDGLAATVTWVKRERTAEASAMTGAAPVHVRR